MEILIALIGIIGAFVGGYFGARWQAGRNLAQWRRDRLLQFSSDLMAAGIEIENYARTVHAGGQAESAIQAEDRLNHAFNCIKLLSSELDSNAFQYVRAILLVQNEALKLQVAEAGTTKETLSAKMSSVAEPEVAFTMQARKLMLALQPEPSLWSLVWAWVRRSRAWTRIRSGIVSTVTERPAAPPPPTPVSAPPEPPPPLVAPPPA